MAASTTACAAPSGIRNPTCFANSSLSLRRVWRMIWSRSRPPPRGPAHLRRDPCRDAVENAQQACNSVIPRSSSASPIGPCSVAEGEKEMPQKSVGEPWFCAPVVEPLPSRANAILAETATAGPEGPAGGLPPRCYYLVRSGSTTRRNRLPSRSRRGGRRTRSRRVRRNVSAVVLTGCAVGTTALTLRVFPSRFAESSEAACDVDGYSS